MLSIQPSMALCIGGGSVCTGNPQSHFSLRRQSAHPNNPSLSSFGRRSSHVTGAKKFSSRTGRFDSKNKKSGGGLTTTTKEGGVVENESIGRASFPEEEKSGVVKDEVNDGYFLPELPGDKTDFWEGPQWNAFGFFIQYQWAFGIVFALIACGIAVATYNEGATDFKQTPVYKESIQSRELLEEPDASNSDVFEGNPTEEAPSLE